MYKLVNKYGNAVVETESAVKRDHLLNEGYRLVEEPDKDAEENDAAETETPEVPIDDGAAPAATDGEDETAAETPSATDNAATPAPVSEPELPKAPKNKRKSAGAADNADKE